MAEHAVIVVECDMETDFDFTGEIGTEEILEKKKAAIGVRGMKLNSKAVVDQVHFSKNAVESSIEYNGKKKIKLGKRESKGVKIRV